MSKNTHEVIDRHYTEEENNVVFQGTNQECNDYVTEQARISKADSFMLKVQLIIDEEYFGSINEMRQSEYIEKADNGGIFSRMRD